jgi:hypothetical protein
MIQYFNKKKKVGLGYSKFSINRHFIETMNKYMDIFLKCPHFLKYVCLAIYCCKILTSKILHNRPHLGQGGSPESPPTLGRTPRGQVLRGASLYPTHYLLPPYTPRRGGTKLGSDLFTNTSRERGRDGVIAIPFNWNWKRDHGLLYPLPRLGKGNRDHTPVLATAIVTCLDFFWGGE